MDEAKAKLIKKIAELADTVETAEDALRLANTLMTLRNLELSGLQK